MGAFLLNDSCTSPCRKGYANLCSTDADSPVSPSFVWVFLAVEAECTDITAGSTKTAPSCIRINPVRVQSNWKRTQVQVISAQADSAANRRRPTRPEEHVYLDFAISFPVNDETVRDNQGNVTVSVLVEPVTEHRGQPTRSSYTSMASPTVNRYPGPAGC